MASGSSSSSKSPMQQNSNQPEHPLSHPDEDNVLSPSAGTLLNVNRYVCEECNKGFPRMQNLTLHRRVHNLPFSLKPRAPRQPVKRKAYLCPEPTCQHHNRSHALGDFGGLKKHYLRKHCTEKNYQCHICSKLYAAETDLKAHLKVCGKRRPINRRDAQFARGNNFVAHREGYATQEHEAVARRSSTLRIGESSRTPTTNNNNSHLIGSTTPYAPTVNMGADNSMRSNKGKAVVGHSPTLQMGDRLGNNNFLLGSRSSYAPTYNMGESTMGNTRNDNRSSLIGLYASQPDPHISAIQNLSKSHPFDAPNQSQFYPSGIDNGSLMTDPSIGSNLGQIFPDFFSPSSSQQNQHRLQADFDSGFYSDLIKGKMPLENVNHMGDDMNIYGNAGGSSSNTINGVFFDQSSYHNLMPLDNMNLMGDGMYIYGNGEGSSSNTNNGVFVDPSSSHNLMPLDNVNLMGDGMYVYGNGEGSSSNTINGVFGDPSSSHNLIPGVNNASLNGMPNPEWGVGSSTFNQELDGNYDQASNYGYGDWNGQSDYGYGYGMEVSDFETSAATAGEEAPYGQLLDQFRGFWL